jgi:ABC-2 type transport system ATP-binding protein
VAFVGANGSGKTTLLRALLGLLRFEGKITVCGSDVSREPEIALQSVAYIPQIAPPIDAPVGEVIRAHAALRGFDLSRTRARAHDLYLDLDEKKRFRDLSGGMKQKLLAAMALAAEAPILVCDEPTANLDGEARAAFFELLSERRGTVVLCSHRLEEVRQIVDRVVELGDGRVVRDASLAELFARLRAFRVDVVLRPGSDAAEAFLRASGFEGKTRMTARLTHHEKLDVVTRLLRHHADAVTDVSVVPVEEIGFESSPRLKVVGA